MVPRERLELSLLSKTDFESAASTDSATEARWARSIGRRQGVVNRAGFDVNALPSVLTNSLNGTDKYANSSC